MASGNKASMSIGRDLSDTAGDDVMAVNDDEKFGPWGRPVRQVPMERPVEIYTWLVFGI